MKCYANIKEREKKKEGKKSKYQREGGEEAYKKEWRA